MPSPPHATSTAAYRPTSLDFINLPNPIEPSAGLQRHPLNGTPRLENARLEKTTTQGLFHLIHDSALPPTGSTAAAGERTGKRQKLSESTLLDLPKLPVRHATKRMRIPPTLSGLHHPPPDAGLLPSINIEKPHGSRSPRPSNLGAGVEQSPGQPASTENTDLPQSEKTVNEVPGDEPPSSSDKRTKRTKWTAEETRCLLQGVARFGIGNWTKILNCPDLKFNRRTAIDLKDRFRVCRPADYGPSTSSREHAAVSDNLADGNNSPGGQVSERVSTSQLKVIGIDQPFAKSSRRRRRGYSRAEDDALLKGFRLYGNAWATIRSDESLGLSARTATDLRDRFRTRYPEEYADVGLAVRQDKSSSKRSGPLPANTGNETAVAKPKPAKKPPAPALFSLDDIFWGADSGIDQNIEEGEPIVLDRGILDWAFNDSHKNSGIDPKLTSSSHTHTPGLNSLQTGVTSLPSLASIKASGNLSIEYNEMPELPSIVEWLNTVADKDSNASLIANASQYQDDHPG